MDSLYASLAHDLGVPVSDLPAPPSAPLTPRPQPPRTPIPKPRPLRRLSLPPQSISARIPEHPTESSIRSTRSISTSATTSISTTSTSTIPDSPRSSTSSISSTSSPSPSPSSTPSPPSSPTHNHTLRRIPSPRRLTLRELRAKESEACLQRAYESTTVAYLEGTLIRPPVPPRSRLRELSWAAQARRGVGASRYGSGYGGSSSSSSRSSSISSCSRGDGRGLMDLR